MMAVDEPQGGPSTPVATVYTLDTVPVALVDVRPFAEYPGAVQPTGTLLLTGEPNATVGSPVALLHSRMFPVDEAAKPLPVRVTVEPLVKPVSGAAVTVPDANAVAATPNVPRPAPSKVTAPMRAHRTSRPPEP